MADFKDRLPFSLHPVAAWIEQMALEKYIQDLNEENGMRTHWQRFSSWSDMLYGWATAIDGETQGQTWHKIIDAYEAEVAYIRSQA